MQSKRPFYILVALLFIVGISASIYRGIEHNVPFLPGKQVQSWAIDAKISFQGTGEPAEISFALPQDPAFEILAENTTSPGYGLSITDEHHERRAVWSTREAQGKQDLYYKVTLIPTGQSDLNTDTVPATPVPYIWPATEKVAAEQVIAEVWSRSASNISYAQQLMKALTAQDRSQNVELLLSSNKPSTLFMNMLHAKGIPARIVNGLYLEDQRRHQELVPFVEVYQDNQWHLFNPATGEQGRPDNLLLWERDGQSVLDVIGGVNSQASFSMLQDTRSALATSIDLIKSQSKF